VISDCWEERLGPNNRGKEGNIQSRTFGAIRLNARTSSSEGKKRLDVRESPEGASVRWASTEFGGGTNQDNNGAERKIRKGFVKSNKKRVVYRAQA